MASFACYYVDTFGRLKIRSLCCDGDSRCRHAAGARRSAHQSLSWRNLEAFASAYPRGVAHICALALTISLGAVGALLEYRAYQRVGRDGKIFGLKHRPDTIGDRLHT